jgi:HPr Serine kinase C-terminal domain
MVAKPVRTYRFHELSLMVRHEAAGPGEELARTLDDLSWVRGTLLGKRPSFCLSVHQQAPPYRAPPTVSPTLQTDGFHGYEYGDEYYLTTRAAQWHLHLRQGRGEAWLAPDFAETSARLRRSFWGFGVFKLLRTLGVFSLHAASVVSTSGVGLLIVGAPGSGKSTLALGLLRRGWGYLSDDAVLLRLRTDTVEALACRRDAYVNADDAARYADLPWGKEAPDGPSGCKRRLCVAVTYPGQIVSRCIPKVLLLPRIVDARRSTVRPLDRTHALRQLLTQSGPQLFDRLTMDAHLAVLTCLLEQAVSYELQAGRDLYEEPLTLRDLVPELTGAR